MQDTDLDCPRCGSSIKKIDQWHGYRLECRDCRYKVQGFLSRFYVEIENIFRGAISA